MEVTEGDIEEAVVDIVHMVEAEAGEIPSICIVCICVEIETLNTGAGAEDEGIEREYHCLYFILAAPCIQFTIPLFQKYMHCC